MDTYATSSTLSTYSKTGEPEGEASAGETFGFRIGIEKVHGEEGDEDRT